MNKSYFNSPIGRLFITENNGNIVSVSYSGDESFCNETELIKKAKKQLFEYFNGERKIFDLPILADGTDFQKKVWSAISEIPYGETKTYGEISKAIGSSKASRAVGMACNRNPIAIIIPCHRVIGSGGNPVGYAGGIDRKNFLLELEKR